MEAFDLFGVSEQFVTDHHNADGCISCHGGEEGINSKYEAHRDYIDDPSAEDEKYCASCHGGIVDDHAAGLHATQAGFASRLLARAGGTQLTSDMEQALDENCSGCHTTCGQCHISSPDMADGGLVDGHVFKKKPNQSKNCVPCHESTIGAEFTGENGRLAASVHYTGGMTCTDCHMGTEMHGDSNDAADSRYEVETLPACRDCHDDGLDSKNEMHVQHIDDLECHTCHSLPFANCYYCHAESPGSQNALEPGVQFDPEIDFRIGYNPMKDDRHTSDYAVLRHVPIHRDTFADYGIELHNFGSQPTWRYASPHNIQLETPQNKSCNKCHGNPNIFLTEFYVNIKVSQGLITEEEVTANQGVILEEVPSYVAE